ncbi:hypothetical protein J2Y69_000188 [Microbacterium resistens]|uniref:DUF4245 domain-containing protein n=1 Tax=Microbacterium resistens TaxID=156977 RepID=A0ABU1S7L0_9MICO|nr:DUF4245 family protein [Microbacterium resistens]MDR6865606.1 hypothetical protein [Microbacterium resistens]
MSRPSAPVVAELGRPETPSETAERKAASSAAYRSSQNFRSLIAALVVTLAVVIVIVLIVPRGEPAPKPPIDLPGIAANAETAIGGPVVLPEVPEGWAVNRAELTGGAVTVWDVTIAPTGDNDRGFAHIAQAVDVGASWAATPLKGTPKDGTVSIAGRDWDVYKVARPADSANVSYALGTAAGPDYVLIYGSLSEKTAAGLAESLAPQLDAVEGTR